MSWWWQLWQTQIITLSALISFAWLRILWRVESITTQIGNDAECVESAAQFSEDLGDKTNTEIQNSEPEKLRFLNPEDEFEILENSADEQTSHQEAINAANQLAIEQAEATTIMAAAFGNHV